jgi:hypothetical protein
VKPSMQLSLFEPKRPKTHRLLIYGLFDAILLALTAIAFFLLDLVFRQYLKPEDLGDLRILMIALFTVIFIFDTALAWLRSKE